MKYNIYNKKTKIITTVDNRKKPVLDPDLYTVTRVREKVETITSNQKHRARRAERLAKK